ncbi:MAG: HdeA/HdeB family chaperone [Pikeienuella sp.]
MNPLMKNLIRGLLAASFLIYAPQAMASDEQADTEFDLTALSCWEVITLPERDATFVIALLIGFKQGTAGASQMTGAAIETMVTKLDVVCAESPNMPAINALN